MSCDALREAIVEIGRGQDVGRGTAAAVETHLAHCRSCSALLERERELSVGLRALASGSSHNTASPDLERSLLAAFRERQSPAFRPRMKVWVPLAAAAMLLVGVGLWVLRSSSHNPTVIKPDSVHAVQSAAPAPAIPAAKPMTVPTEPQAATVVATGRRSRLPRQRPPRFVTAEGFVMLPAALNLPAFESGEIVRMELPVTSLPAYGLEIAPETRRSVEADFLVGQDGQARAIRLVNSVRLQPNQ
jgi:anti-sigma factor RsiW